ncbi:MAG: restriction endonuclease subunit S [Chitinophagaceae bacterium]|nr:restriction endonuclease subunit S [Chitinophagaceae bacterium]
MERSQDVQKKNPEIPESLNPVQDKGRPGYKHTPLGWIPKEWEVVRFDAVFEFLSTNSFSRENLTEISTENNIQNIHYGDIHAKFKNELLDCENEILPKIKDGVTIIQYSNFIKDGDLIITDASEDYEGVGKCIEVMNVGDKKILSGLHTFLARDNSGLTAQGFRTYIFRNPKVNKELKRIATGISVYSISKRNLETLKLTIPTFVEQRRIAAILSTWDEAITKTQQLIAQLQQRNKGLMQQLLTGKKRLKGFEKTKFSLSPINSFAKEISDKNRQDKDLIVLSCTKYHGLVPSLEYFGRKIYSDNLTTYKIVSKNCFAYATNHIEEGSIGYQSQYDEALISPMYTVFKTNHSVDDEFLYKILKSHHYIHEYQKRMEGSIDRRGGLRWNEFSKIKVPVPSLGEQKQIAAILSHADNELQLYEQKLGILQQQKKGLMQKLLTGEVRVKIDNN